MRSSWWHFSIRIFIVFAATNLNANSPSLRRFALERKRSKWFSPFIFGYSINNFRRSRNSINWVISHETLSQRILHPVSGRIDSKRSYLCMISVSQRNFWIRLILSFGYENVFLSTLRELIDKIIELCKCHIYTRNIHYISRHDK